MKVGSLGWILPFTLVLAAGCGSDGVPVEDSIDEQTQAYIDEMLAVGEFANVGRRCATPDLSNATAEAIDAIAAGRRVGPATLPVDDGPINVYLHEIIDDDETTGNIGGIAIGLQMIVLNLAYADFATFELADNTETINGAWFNAGPGSLEEIEMKRELHQGGRRALNIYTNRPSGDVLGWATFPFLSQFLPKIDGIVADHRTFPFGSIPPYNEGDTLVHEVGHWLGLFHTFQGRCLFGDRVADTPAERTASYNCNEERDTCALVSGTDPVHNFMDYTDDICADTFTEGQLTRAEAQYTSFRSGQGD